jgi:formate dehydrogenase assembly factor FdhD
MCTDEYRRTLCGVCEKESTEQERKKSEDTRTEECETAKKERGKCPKEQRNDQERDGSCQVCGQSTLYGLYDVGTYW